MKDFMKLEYSDNLNKDLFFKLNQTLLEKIKRNIKYFNLEFEKQTKGFLRMNYEINSVTAYLTYTYENFYSFDDQFKMKTGYSQIKDLEKEMNIRLNQLGYMDYMINKISNWILHLQVETDYLEHMKKIQKDYTRKNDKH